jgi:hypothetical protein
MNIVQIPIAMTSNTTPEPFVVTGPGTDPCRVFDYNDSTSWSSTDLSSSITIDLGRTYYICRWHYSWSSTHDRTITLQGSVDGLTWYTLGSHSIAAGTNASGTLNTSTEGLIGFRYVKLLVPGVGGYPSSVRTIRLYTLENTVDHNMFETSDPSEYYVSQQNGSDDNNGLSPTTAWATIDKAFKEVKANELGDTYVHIGPGIYRENPDMFIPLYSGIDSSHRIIYKADPDCLRLTNDKPGAVLLSNHSEQEQALSLSLPQPNYLQLNYRHFIEFYNLSLMNLGYGNAIGGTETSSGLVINNCKIWSNTIGCNNITAINSIVLSKSTCFNSCKTYNCVAIGSNTSASYAGFSGGSSYNCLAALCAVGYLNNTSYNSEAWLCNSVASGGSATNCLASQCYVTSLPAGWTGTMCGQTSASVINTSSLVVQKLNLINTLRTGLADWGYDLSAIPEAMVDFDGISRNSSTSDIGPWELADYSLEYNDFYLNKSSLRINGHNQVIFDLPVKEGQEITKSIYVKWFEPDMLNTKLNIVMDSDTTSGHMVEASSVTVGFEPWKAFDADSATYWSSSGNLPQWISYEFPQPEIANKYVLGIPAGCQDLTVKTFTFEGWNGVDWIVLDTQTNIVWTSGETKTFTFENTTAYKKYRLNIAEVQTSILNIYSFEIWGTLGKSNIDDSLKPQIVVSGFGETYEDSCTVVGGLWEKLSVTFTPIKSGVIAVKLVTRNPASGSYAIFSDPQ